MFLSFERDRRICVLRRERTSVVVALKNCVGHDAAASAYLEGALSRLTGAMRGWRAGGAAGRARAFYYKKRLLSGGKEERTMMLVGRALRGQALYDRSGLA